MSAGEVTRDGDDLTQCQTEDDSVGLQETIAFGEENLRQGEIAQHGDERDQADQKDEDDQRRRVFGQERAIVVAGVNQWPVGRDVAHRLEEMETLFQRARRGEGRVLLQQQLTDVRRVGVFVARRLSSIEKQRDEFVAMVRRRRQARHDQRGNTTDDLQAEEQKGG